MSFKSVIGIAICIAIVIFIIIPMFIFGFSLVFAGAAVSMMEGGGINRITMGGIGLWLAGALVAYLTTKIPPYFND